MDTMDSMNDQQNLVQGASVPNDSEQTAILFGTIQNYSEQEQRSVQNVSEETEIPSEQRRNESSVSYRTAPTCSPEHGEMTITVREAARIFEEAGVPRTERAITNWCNQNTRGVTRLDCCYNENERKYYISPQSIERVIVEERRKNQYTEYQSDTMYSSSAEELAVHVRNERESAEEQKNDSHRKGHGLEAFGTERENMRKASEQMSNVFGRVQNTSEGSHGKVSNEDVGNRSQPLRDDIETHEQLRELKMENYELRVQLEGQKHLIRKFDELVAGERERHEKEKLALIDRLTDARYQIGSLEQRLLQLEAPKTGVREAVVMRGGEENKFHEVIQETEQRTWH